MAPKIETRLLSRLQQGDLTAFDALYEKYHGRIFAYVTGMLGDRRLAEDIVQEVFVTLVRRRRSVDPRRGVGPWLYRTARNRAIDTVRRRKFEQPMPEPRTNADAALSDDPARAAERSERHSRLRRALAALPVAERDLLLLRYYGDLPFREIAATLRRPLGTVLWQAQRSLKKLKRHLDTGEAITK